MKKLVLYCIMSILLLFACSSHGNKAKIESIQIKGSDTIVNLIQVWAENFIKSHPNLNISITGGGSGTGFASLINKTCDIAMSSREVEDIEVALAKQNNVNPIGFKVGLDGLVVIVNRDNPVTQLTLTELKNIFMAKITNWKEVGGQNRKIVILSREANSGTHMFFKEHVIRSGYANSSDEFSVHSLMMPSSQAVYDEVLQNPNALGYVGMGFVDNKIKVISVAVDENSKYIYPTRDTVVNGSYPISRPLYLYTNGKPEGIIEMFIDYAVSDEGQKIVVDTDFVPIKKD
ncbi:MAG: PstS family phosphate ABC transporter substrate-binding protein [Endomicrobium sp.]|uniref:PstS family phosphate ABC transporter substrate-binding protein n=1 Tax=Candidatus Endomicrobiellum cubanum TaxID=3242325 RepID=UPI00282FB03B|nr:PstS family phosphate ABC transporter substrate-binding protein [Endomicrobium sp.]